MHAKSVIFLDSPFRFDMTRNLRFETLRELCLIDLDIDIAAFVNILGLLKSLDMLHVNNKHRFGNSCCFWYKKNKRRFNCFKVFQEFVQSKLELVGLSWSISFNPQKDLSFGNAPKIERLVLTDTVILHDDYVAQV